jgi:hypothetical protein
MKLSAQYRETPPPPPPVPAGAGELPVAVDPDDDAPYLAAWLSYRKRWREIWINGFNGFVTLAGLALYMERNGNPYPVIGLLWPIWGMVGFAMFAVSAIRIVAFACPRCGGSFFTLGRPFTSQMKCPHCGLRKFHVDDHGTPLYRLILRRRREQA